jgi:squalene cyclase
MRLKYNAVSYVFKNGNPFHKLKLLLILDLQPEKRLQLAGQLRAMQNRDGGWPWQLQEGKPSGISQTARTLELLLKTSESKNSDITKRAVTFLFQKQNKDGGWSENPELKEIIPEDWNWISTEHSGYQTADVINAL